MAAEKQFKVVLLGEGAVGKTSITMRYTADSFNEQHKVTVQASFQTKRLTVEGQRVMLAVWDTAGQERFHALGPIYYRDSNGALLVYDITDHDSFVRVQNWVTELRQMLGSDVALAIAGNKIDLERNRAVTQEEAEAYAASVGATHFHTSAKLNKGIDELFSDLAKRMLDRAKPGAPTSRGGASAGARGAAGGSGTVGLGGPGSSAAAVGMGKKKGLVFDEPADEPAPSNGPCCGS